MSLSQFSKDHGRSILSAGLLSLAFSVTYVGNGMFKRFDEVREVADSVKTTVADVKDVQGKIKDDMTTFRKQFPALGTEAGEATAKGVEAYKKVTSCTEDGEGCEKVETAQKLLDRLKKKQP